MGSFLALVRDLAGGKEVFFLVNLGAFVGARLGMLRSVVLLLFLLTFFVLSRVGGISLVREIERLFGKEGSENFLVILFWVLAVDLRSLGTSLCLTSGRRVFDFLSSILPSSSTKSAAMKSELTSTFEGGSYCTSGTKTL